MEDRTIKALTSARAALLDERAKLEAQIATIDETLETLDRGGAPMRSVRVAKKTKTPRAVKAGGKRPRKKPEWSPAKRREAAERMRKYWANWRKKNAGKKKASKKKASKKARRSKR